MKIWVVLLFLFFSICNTEQVFQRVITIVLENTDYSVAVADPNLAALAQQGTLQTNYFAETHPSLPNYIAMIAGDYFGIRSNNPVNLNYSNVVDLLEDRGLTWIIYQEDFPGNCSLGDSYPYTRRHNPFIQFLSISLNQTRCANIVNAQSRWPVDVNANTLANYSFYTPNLLNDGHDTGVAYAGSWTYSFLSPLLTNSTFMANTLIFVVFDEASMSSPDNHIYALLLGPYVRKNATDSTRYNHYSMLRTIQLNWNLGNLSRNDVIATPFNLYPPVTPPTPPSPPPSSSSPSTGNPFSPSPPSPVSSTTLINVPQSQTTPQSTPSNESPSSPTYISTSGNPSSPKISGSRSENLEVSFISITLFTILCFCHNLLFV